MDLNPFTKPLDELRTRAAQLDSDLRQIHKGIADYESSTEDDRVDRLNECVDIHNERLVKFQQAEQQVENARKQLRKVESATGTLLNPLNWFDDEQEQLRKSRDALVLQVRDLERRRDHLSLKFRSARAEYLGAKDCLDRHRSFDIKAARDRRARLADELQIATVEIDQLALRWSAVDEALRPHVAAIAEIERKLKDTMARRSLAEDLQSRLDEADDGYERKLIHEECEQALGLGNPRKVLNETRSLVEVLERDLDKTVNRAKKAAHDAGLVINSIVIDGNNMCFTSGSRFVGVEVLQRVVTDLSSKFQLIIVFDASIRGRLGLDDKAIRRRLNTAAEVHIMPSRETADETVLDLAGTQPDRFVLSNDRYAEFADKPAVAERRLLKHEIVDGRVFIRALKYQANWKP